MAFSISSGDTFTNRGTFDTTSGTFLQRDDSVVRGKLVQEDLVVYGIPLYEGRVWDDLNALLPGTAATDDLAFIEGTWGTDAPTLQTSDAKATTVTQYARFMAPLPAEYVSGQTVQVQVVGGMITTVSDGTATVDLECYLGTAAGGVGSDLCTTAATTINALMSGTPTTVAFTITPGSLVPGDVLDMRFKVAITDSATATAVIGEISKIALLLDIKG